MKAKILQVIRYVPLAAGAAGIVGFSAYAAISGRLFPPTLTAVTGMIISVILILSNLWHLIPESRQRRYSRALLVLYVLGVLVMGLRPKGTYEFRSPGTLPLLDAQMPPTYYVTMNVVGFIPLGFLFVLAFTQSRRFRTNLARITAAVLLCTIISLFIEATQHLIVSRMSSLIDLVSNSAGGLIGALYGLVHTRLWHGSEAKCAEAGHAGGEADAAAG